jgi:uncharacterized damage-inducible protein DinB
LFYLEGIIQSKRLFMKRRKFIQSAALGTAGLSGILSSAKASDFNMPPDPESLFVIGPMEGYSPQIGTIVSMLNYNRSTIINTTKDLTMEQLDYLFDAKANTIGALIMHLGATDKFYQINTFEGRTDFNDEEKKIWGAASNLGEEGRKQIKGHELKYYIDLVTDVREKTLAELKKRDDKWLMAVDPKFGDGKTKFNTYWKWFHVCEHESNHRGQITWLKRRLPGAKDEGE